MIVNLNAVLGVIWLYLPKSSRIKVPFNFEPQMVAYDILEGREAYVVLDGSCRVHKPGVPRGPASTPGLGPGEQPNV